MAYQDWRIRGPALLNCNCDWGCPCQFNALPTRGDCRGLMGMEIEEGHFGQVSLSGIRFAVLLAWPGAIHEGRGEAWPVLDERTTPEQREALLTIISGLETEPGATVFNVFAATFEIVHEPAFASIELEADKEGRKGRLRIDGIVDTLVEPIRNPVTGTEHRVRVVLPEGFEYREAEYASGDTTAEGPIPMDWTKRHAHLATLDLSTHGAR